MGSKLYNTWLGRTGLAAAFICCMAMVAAFTGSSKEVSGTGVKANQPMLQERLAEADGKTQLQSVKKAEKSIHETVVAMESAQTFESRDETVYVTNNQVNLRTGSSTSSQIITRLNKGDSLKRTGYSSSWSKVVYNNQECYISSQYVTTAVPGSAAVPAQASSGTYGGTGSGKLIAIDAGHQGKGNSDKEPIAPGSSTMKAKVASGATGVASGLHEYQLNLLVAEKLKAELENRGYRTFMVRTSHDVDISNAQRAVMANESGADIFIRVHANSLDNQSVAGALTMCQTKNNPWNGSLYGKSSSLSKLVTDNICANTGFQNRGVQETDTMSGINWCTIPVTIVEMGFMSNAEEDRKMATDEYQTKIAKGIADGIDAYYAAGN